MKKILIIFLLCLLFISSCKKDNEKDPNEQKDKDIEYEEYQFKDQEEIKKQFSICRIVVLSETNDSDGNNKTTTIEYMENDQLVYLLSGTREFLYDKNEELSYELNSGTKTKTILEEKIDPEEWKNQIFKLLFAHYGLKTNFVKTMDNYNNYEVEKYKETLSKDDASSEEYYLVSTKYGITLRHYISFRNKIKSSSADIKVNLSFDEHFIENELNEYLEFEDVKKATYYDVWPNTLLGNMLPELRSGSYKVAFDDEEKCYIYKEKVVSTDITTYFKKLSSYGFTNPKQFNYDDGDIYYLNYNADYVLVKIEFYSDIASCAITIKYSNEQEINDTIKQYERNK